MWDICFVNADIGWAVGDGGIILHTTDGGNTWVEQSSGLSSSLKRICFTDPDNGWTLGDEGGLLHTVNGGITWEIQHHFWLSWH
ncbi:MAG: hypothetical protein K8R53_00425, partial [Bacteroidales bacterium]|nr:hypothetical protein [Bacteroidales bacterium]